MPAAMRVKVAPEQGLAGQSVWDTAQGATQRVVSKVGAMAGVRPDTLQSGRSGQATDTRG